MAIIKRDNDYYEQYTGGDWSYNKMILQILVYHFM